MHQMRKNLTQTGLTLALMAGKDGVGNNPMKVPKGWVAYESHFEPLKLYAT